MYNRVSTTIAFLAVLAAVSSAAHAQGQDESSVPPLPSRSAPVVLTTAPDLSEPDAAQRAAEVAAWIDEFSAWQEWSAQWTNRRQPGWVTSYRERMQKPDPPAWLAGRCIAVFDEEDPLMPACTLLSVWQQNSATAPIRQAQVMATTQAEAERKTEWWEHLHMDMLWPAMQWRASIYGVVGMHAATQVGKRLQVFLTPGVMLLNLPSRDGTRVWKVAGNYGIGYRLFDFSFPGNHPAALHVNLAKAWVMSDKADVVTRQSVDFVGLSIAFKRPH